MKGRAVLAAAAAAFAIAPASALAADPPEGAAISDNLDYVTRVAGARGITEGKFDRVRGDDVLVVTGRFGFKTYDVSDPEDPQELDTFLPGRARRVRLLAGRGHGARHAPQADHRRARPASQRRRSGDSPAARRPGPRTAVSATPTA